MVLVRRYGLNWNEYIRTRKYGKPVRRTLISATFIFECLRFSYYRIFEKHPMPDTPDDFVGDGNEGMFAFKKQMRL